MSLRVTCINKTEHQSPHERIQRIGGENADGSRWLLTTDEAIATIERQRSSFYVNVGGRTVDVIVAAHERHRYLKTTTDGYSPDNLLSLPECN